MLLGKGKPWHWAKLCNIVQRVWDASWSPVQCSMGPSKVYGTPDVAGWVGDSGGFTAGIQRQWTQSSPNIRERSCTPGV